MKINMSQGPETIPGRILDLVKGMQLERGGMVNLIRTDQKRNIWTMRIVRNGRELRFQDLNKSTELRILGVSIPEIIKKLRGVCAIEKHGEHGDRILQYVITAEENEKEAVA